MVQVQVYGRNGLPASASANVPTPENGSPGPSLLLRQVDADRAGQEVWVRRERREVKGH